MSGKRDPWIKFYFADWRAEPRLKMCSRAARSLWLDMLGLMHEAAPYGFLLVEGIVPTTQQLANLVGDPERQVKVWLEELRLAGVYSMVGQPMPDDVQGMIPLDAPEGAILSRRMVRDADKRERDRVNGKGGGNPKLTGRGLTGGDNLRVGDGDKPQRRVGLKPRSQKPETRLTPKPPSAPVNPPAPMPCWDEHRDKALKLLGSKICEHSIFPCSLVLLATDEVAMEAPTRQILSRVIVHSQRLHDLLGMSVKFRLSVPVTA